jgi:hypothetical protein
LLKVRWLKKFCCSETQTQVAADVQLVLMSLSSEAVVGLSSEDQSLGCYLVMFMRNHDEPGYLSVGKSTN